MKNPPMKLNLRKRVIKIGNNVMVNFISKGLIAAAIVASGNCSLAQDSDFGKTAYNSSCAACHGADGKGNGPVSTELKTKPSDLTALAKKNNGVFPVETMHEIIDARKSVAAHGTREMPVWGYWFLSFGPDTQHIVQNRISAIIDYVNRIQVK